MAAHEEQLEALVGDRAVAEVAGHERRNVEEPDFRGERPLAAETVDRAIPPRRHEPGSRGHRDAVPRPPLDGRGERLLGGLLGELDVAEKADERSDDAPPLVPEDLLEDP